MRIMIFLLLFCIKFVVAQSVTIGAGYGTAKYDHKKAQKKNAFFIEAAKEWMVYKPLTFDIAIGYTNKDIFLHDVIIFPLYSVNSVKIYNNDLSININYIELPFRLGMKFNIYKNFYIKPYWGFALDFALKTQINIKNKQLLYEGDYYHSSLVPDFTTNEELKYQNSHTSRNTQIGLDIGLKHYIIGFLIKDNPPPKAIGRLMEFDNNIFAYYLQIRFDFL